MNKYNQFTKDLNKQTREVFKSMKSFEGLTKEIEVLQKQASSNPEALRRLEAIMLLEKDQEFNMKLNKLKSMVKNLEIEYEKISIIEEGSAMEGKAKGGNKLKINQIGYGSKLFLNRPK